MSSITVLGHPEVTAVNEEGRKMRISVCAECGELRTILWLTGDRWYCRSCRAEGAGKSTLIPVTNPARRR